MLIALDIGMDRKDLNEATKAFIGVIFKKIGLGRPDVRISFVTFDEDVNVLFLNRLYSNTTQDLTTRQTSYFQKSSSQVLNFTRILSSLVDLISDSKKGRRDTAKKVLLIVSNFKFNIDKTDVQDVLRGHIIDIYTIGMNFEDGTFRKMLILSPSPFHVGTIGSIFADKVDVFLDAFISQLSYVKC